MDDEDIPDYRPRTLPEGVKKEVITEADSSQWRHPKKGDELTVHYVGTLEDGTEFDSSRKRGEPIKFTFGLGQVIKGWEHGFGTMKKGEIAKLIIQPEHAYGEAGQGEAGGGIPPNATLTFEVELINILSKDDVFRDGGVVKSITQEGEGWDTPKQGEEVKCSFKALSKSGDVIQEMEGFETIMGKCALKPEALATVFDKVLSDMKLSEKCSLLVSEDYIFKGQGEVTIEMHLEAMYETADVSFLQDGSVIKKRVVEGKEYAKPADDVKVTLRVEAVTDGSSPLSEFTGPKEISFTTGRGEASDAMECTAIEMKQGERAIVTCNNASKCFDDLLGLGGVKAEKIVFTLELLDFDKKEKEIGNMGGTEKMMTGLDRKEQGGELFKRKRFELALMKYKKVTELMGQNDGMSKDNKQRAAELKHIAEMNKAACYLQLGDPTSALATCNKILATDRNNTKALLRRAKAHFSRHEHRDALRDLERVLELDAGNTEATALIPKVKQAQKVLDKGSASTYKHMFENLGKVGFGKEIKKPEKPARKAEPEDEQSKDHVAVTFRMDHKIEPGEQLFVVGAPEEIGAWDVSKGVQLKRIPGPPDYEAMALGKVPKETHLWEAPALLPVVEGRTEYHYVVKSPSGERVEGEKHVMLLAGMGGSRLKNSDRWRDKPAWQAPEE